MKNKKKVCKIKINEWDIINEILSEYNGHPYNGNIDPLLKVQQALIKIKNILSNLDPIRFQVHKNSFISLSKIKIKDDIVLTPDEKKQFTKLNLAFDNPEFINCLNDLRQEYNNDNTFIKEAIIKVQQCCIGECLMLAASKKDPIIFEKVGKLCDRYRMYNIWNWQIYEKNQFLDKI